MLKTILKFIFLSLYFQVGLSQAAIQEKYKLAPGDFIMESLGQDWRLVHRTSVKNFLSMLKNLDKNQGFLLGVTPESNIILGRGYTGDRSFYERVFLEFEPSKDFNLLDKERADYCKKSGDTPIMLIFSPLVLDRIKDYHISLGWIYGRLSQSSAPGDDFEKVQEVIKSIKENPSIHNEVVFNYPVEINFIQEIVISSPELKEYLASEMNSQHIDLTDILRVTSLNGFKQTCKKVIYPFQSIFNGTPAGKFENCLAAEGAQIFSLVGFSKIMGAIFSNLIKTSN